jgi:Cu-processing system permease protein
MRQVVILTINAFREIVRERTVGILFFGAVVLLVLSFFVGSLSFDEQRRILIHLGFGAIHLTCLAIVLFKGAYLIQREIDRQTCLMVLVRPISRFQFLLGQYLAIVLLLIVHLSFQSLMLSALLGFQADPGRFLTVIMGIFVEMCVILSLIVLATQWVRPVLALFSGLVLFLVGNWLEEMKFFADKTKDQDFQVVTDIIRWLMPNLFVLNYRSEGFLLANQTHLPLLPSVLHFSLWIGIFLILAGISFSRRDLV